MKVTIDVMNDLFENNLPSVNNTEQKTWKLSSPQKKRILLLDDDPAVRQILLRLLSDEEYCVSTATDGAEAVAQVAVAKYDLVLLDLNTPDEQGKKAVARIAADHPQTPVVVVTARPSQFLLALAAGVGVLLEKPLDFVQLFDTIRDLLEESPRDQLQGLLASPAFDPVPLMAGNGRMQITG